MGFISYLGTFTKRCLFFVGGFIMAFPVTGLFMSFGVYPKLYNTPDILQIPAIIFGLVLFIVGLAAMFYALRLKE